MLTLDFEISERGAAIFVRRKIKHNRFEIAVARFAGVAQTLVIAFIQAAHTRVIGVARDDIGRIECGAARGGLIEDFRHKGRSWFEHGDKEQPRREPPTCASAPPPSGGRCKRSTAPARC